MSQAPCPNNQSINQSINQGYAPSSDKQIAESFIDIPSSPPAHIDTIINNHIPSGVTSTEHRRTDNLVRVRKSPGLNDFKSVKFGILNVCSIGNDAKSGQINDFVIA